MTGMRNGSHNVLCLDDSLRKSTCASRGEKAFDRTGHADVLRSDLWLPALENNPFQLPELCGYLIAA